MMVLSQLIARSISWLFKSWSSRSAIANVLAALGVALVLLLFAIVVALRINYRFNLGVSIEDF